MTATEPSGMDLTNSSLRTSYSYSQFSPSRVCLNYRHFLINISKTPAILSLIYQGRIASILRQFPNHTYSRLLFSTTDLLSQSFLAKTRLFLTNHPYSRLLFSATDLLCQSFLAKTRVFSKIHSSTTVAQLNSNCCFSELFLETSAISAWLVQFRAISAWEVQIRAISAWFVQFRAIPLIGPIPCHPFDWTDLVWARPLASSRLTS